MYLFFSSVWKRGMKDLFPLHMCLMVKPILKAPQETLGNRAFLNCGLLMH